MGFFSDSGWELDCCGCGCGCDCWGVVTSSWHVLSLKKGNILKDHFKISILKQYAIIDPLTYSLLLTVLGGGGSSLTNGVSKSSFLRTSSSVVVLAVVVVVAVVVDLTTTFFCSRLRVRFRINDDVVFSDLKVRTVGFLTTGFPYALSSAQFRVYLAWPRLDFYKKVYLIS